MRTLLAALIALLPAAAWAQSTAMPVLPGFLTTTGCKNGQSVCFVPSAGPLAYSLSTSASVGTSSGTLLAAGAANRALLICTLPASSANVWLNLTGGAAVASAGVAVPGGGGCALLSSGGPLPLPAATAITAITDGGSSQTVTISGG